jgi:hypothetical protein
MVPIGTLGRVAVEMPLVDGRVGCFLVEPIANAVSTTPQEREWVAI